MHEVRRITLTRTLDHPNYCPFLIDEPSYSDNLSGVPKDSVPTLAERKEYVRVTDNSLDFKSGTFGNTLLFKCEDAQALLSYASWKVR